ncbi:hypothetical protein P692DRAFT_20188626 [Suillus brevipes Sb2]|nr:hypothetical protein P692DRAFT_20188626 [Suillus brevipes Sb2]
MFLSRALEGQHHLFVGARWFQFSARRFYMIRWWLTPPKVSFKSFFGMVWQGAGLIARAQELSHVLEFISSGRHQVLQWCSQFCAMTTIEGRGNPIIAEADSRLSYSFNHA